MERDCEFEKIKSNLRPVFHRMFGQEGKYFYGLHFKRNKSLDGYVLSLLASCGKGDNKTKNIRHLQNFLPGFFMREEVIMKLRMV